jgi:hypothetical protein
MGMPRRVTDVQVKELRRWLNQGASLNQAAMKSGMDRKSARKYRDQGKLPSELKQPRTWRTRLDPLASVWPRLEELLQGEPRLQARTLLDWLQREYPGEYPDSIRRTLERRVRIWKGQHGRAKEVFFTQVHEPGRLGASDFTHMTSLGVTIQGQAFPHLCYHFVLTHSNWEHVTVCFSESFASLSEGFQNALWELGGVPQRHRTDRMTLAVHHDGNAGFFTAKYQALLGHYGVTGEATNPASGHENGDCEQGHRRFKDAVDQALLLRGSRDFASREEYGVFLRAVVRQRNSGRHAQFLEEVAQLRPLPERRLETLERERVKVSRGSTIRVRHNTYSVPARLIGETVEVRLGAEVLEVWYADQWVQRMERLRGQDKHHIDYRHIIDWLVRKPGAFARYRYREDLYPTVTYRQAYDTLLAQQPGRADREYVRLLHVAAQRGEAEVGTALAQLLAGRQPLSVQAVETLLGSDTPLSVAARVEVPAVDLRQYDALLEGTNDGVEPVRGDAGPGDWGQDPSTAGNADQEGTLAVGWARSGSRGGDALLAAAGMERTKEVHNDGTEWRSPEEVFAGAAPAGGACRVRSGGAAGDGGVVELRGLPAGAGAARVPAAPDASDRASPQSLEAAAGKELAGVGPEAAAGQGGAAVAWVGERGLSGPAGQRAGVWPAGFGEDARAGGGGPGVGTGGPTGAVHDVQPAGPGTPGGQARPDAQGPAETAGAVGGVAPRRPGVRAAEPGRDGGAVHAAGGTVRAGQRAGDEQPAVLEVGAGLQGSDDHGGGHRPPGASQRDRGTERAELPSGGGEESQVEPAAAGGAHSIARVKRVGEAVATGWWPGCAAVAVATLRLPPLRQATTPSSSAGFWWGKIIVAQGER